MLEFLLPLRPPRIGGCVTNEMDQTAIVTISSDEDDEFDHKNNKDSSESVKEEITLDDNVEVNSDSHKRKVSDLDDISTATKNEQPEKRMKLSTGIDDIKNDNDTSKLELAKDATDTFSMEKLKLLNDKSISKDNSDIEKANNSLEKSYNGTAKPQLVVKKRIPLVNVSAVKGDAFAMLVHQCLQNDGSSDMKKIIKNLQKHYDRLDPDYANSEDFITYLTETRNTIAKGQNGMFSKLLDVKNTIIDKHKKTSLSNGTNRNNSRRLENNDNAMDVDEIAKANKDEEYLKDKRVKKIEHKMSICSKRIKALEQAEVDFDDESNSYFIKLERYKERMVELYTKYCSITGDNVDAGRAYLRPKHLSVTNISSLDQAITNFVNSKISKIRNNGNRRTRHQALANALIFPNYKDILKCVEKCNEDKKLGMNKEEQEKTAKKAFDDIGTYLQRVRQNDFWDTFSLHLENEDEDPAVTDEDLSKKLQINQRSGEKKLAETIDHFAELQEEADHLRKKEKGLDENAEESEKSEASSDEDDENEDDEDEEEEDENDKSKDNTDTDKDDSADAEVEEDQDDKTDKDKTKKDNEVNKNNSIKESDDSVLHNEDNTAAPSKPEDSESQEKMEGSSHREIVEDVNEVKATNIEACMVGDLKDLSIQEEEKPLLRVRSFAKPPCSWKDSTQETPKKVSAIPLVILTNESPEGSQTLTIDRSVKSNPGIKRTYQVNHNRLNNITSKEPSHPLYNSSKVIKRHVINVKNITNNYVVKVPKVTAPNQPSSSNMLSASPIKLGRIIRIPNHPARIIQQIAISKKPSTTRQDKDVISLTSTKSKK